MSDEQPAVIENVIFAVKHGDAPGVLDVVIGPDIEPWHLVARNGDEYLCVIDDMDPPVELRLILTEKNVDDPADH